MKVFWRARRLRDMDGDEVQEENPNPTRFVVDHSQGGDAYDCVTENE